MTYRYFTTDKQVEWLREEINKLEKKLFVEEIIDEYHTLQSSLAITKEYEKALSALCKKLDELLNSHPFKCEMQSCVNTSPHHPWTTAGNGHMFLCPLKDDGTHSKCPACQESLPNKRHP